MTSVNAVASFMGDYFDEAQGQGRALLAAADGDPKVCTLSLVLHIATPYRAWNGRTPPESARASSAGLRCTRVRTRAVNCAGNM